MKQVISSTVRWAQGTAFLEALESLFEAEADFVAALEAEHASQPAAREREPL